MLTLKNIICKLEQFQSKTAVFGTTPPALFCAIYLKKKNLLDVFLDEDKNKVGKKLLGTEIILPINFNSKNLVIIPYSSEIKNYLQNKYQKINFAQLH